MATATFRKIRSVDPRPNYKVALVWDTGSRATIDMTSNIEAGGVFASLKDVSLFNKVKVGERNRTIEWPQPSDDLGYPIIDIDAESLYKMFSMQKKSELTNKIYSL